MRKKMTRSQNSVLLATTSLFLSSLLLYNQVYGIFNMSCLGVIFRDGMSTPLNGEAAYS